MALCDERKSDFLLPVYLGMDVFKATYWLLHPAFLLAHLMDNNQQSYIYKKIISAFQKSTRNSSVSLEGCIASRVKFYRPGSQLDNTHKATTLLSLLYAWLYFYTTISENPFDCTARAGPTANIQFLFLSFFLPLLLHSKWSYWIGLLPYYEGILPLQP